jgi:hypothetical protein
MPVEFSADDICRQIRRQAEAAGIQVRAADISVPNPQLPRKTAPKTRALLP